MVIYRTNVVMFRFIVKYNMDSTEKELQTEVNQLKDEKSPGIDGITAEFYNHFWYLIGAQYFAYINAVRQTELPAGKNISVTAISLLNVDVKILTKALTNRLKQVLPSVVHHTQTAVDGRRIDHTIYMVRDLDMEAAFIFLDQ